MYRWFLYRVKYTNNMYIYHSESDNNTHVFFKHLYPVWVLNSLSAVKMKDLRHKRSSLMSCTPQKTSACPANGASVLSVITWQFAPVQTVEKFGGDLSHRYRTDRSRLSPEINQHLVLIRWCWCAGCRVTPDDSECVITFLCSRSFRLRSTSNEARILWEALEVAVGGVITELRWVEGKEEGREHHHLIPPPQTQCWSLMWSVGEESDLWVKTKTFLLPL